MEHLLIDPAEFLDAVHLLRSSFLFYGKTQTVIFLSHCDIKEDKNLTAWVLPEEQNEFVVVETLRFFLTL